MLSEIQLGKEPPDVYLYDPLRQVLTVDGQVILPGRNAMGPCDIRKIEGRVPTFSFTVQGMHPRQVAEKLDEAGVYV